MKSSPTPPTATASDRDLLIRRYEESDRAAVRELFEKAAKAGCTRDELEAAVGLKARAIQNHLRALKAVKGPDGRYRLPEEEASI